MFGVCLNEWTMRECKTSWFKQVKRNDMLKRPVFVQTSRNERGHGEEVILAIGMESMVEDKEKCLCFIMGSKTCSRRPRGQTRPPFVFCALRE